MTRVNIPLRLVSEANARGSWHAGASRAAAQRKVVTEALRGHPSLVLPVYATVRIVRVAPRGLDDDNLSRAAKAVRDAVAEWLGVDDRYPGVSWIYAQRRAKAYAVEIDISQRSWWIDHGPDATVLRVPPVEGIPEGRYVWPGLVVDVVCPRSLLKT